VIRAARKHLAYLEQQSVSQATPQLDLFAAPPFIEDAPDEPDDEPPPTQTHPVLDKLRAVDPNDLKPRDALDLLYELHELASAAPDAQR
jgi:DNA mismatch repair protein MutS